ncbi:DUF4377 domain-containing protein [Catalinimonas sp. 4WD22]|uniref:DUF4377 domain-containing protein n=1 Tax=Catalinimonas locisalis TaxID=3133978 RepID=UPI003101B2A8
MSQSIQLGENEKIYWVNSLKAPCEGIAPMHCLQVQQGKSMQEDKWELFYASIEGFDFEAGYVYQLVVREENLPAAQVPEDASSIRYSLVRIISKEGDSKIRLHDIWVLESMEAEPIDESKINDRPRLEIHLPEMRVMGFDGCNNFNGSIKQVDSAQLVFGPIAGTRKLCNQMDVPDQFNALLNQVNSYKVENLKLYLYNKQGNEILSFQKTD